ncbi:MAG: S8 family serine peptidase [Thermoplasmata archaeon]|nr:MAG: S8 family serine peptidase [Thermoplasmata archaeon]
MSLSKNTAVLIIIILITYSFTSWTALANEDEEASIEDREPKWWENFKGDKNQNKIHDQIEHMDPDYRISVFIDYDRIPTDDDVNRLSIFDLDVKFVYKYIEVICARNVLVSDAGIISSLPHVVMVKLEGMVYPALDVSARAIKARESNEYSPNSAHELGFTGAGISVAILDTGVDDYGRNPSQRHESLDDQDDVPGNNDQKFRAGVDFTQEETLLTPRDGSYNPDDTHGHGTHCAGIAMGTGGTSGLYMGVAPGARLIDIKVLEDWTPNQWGEVIAGVDWCIEHKSQFNIRVLSLSLGGGDSDGMDEGSMIVNRAVEEGLIVVVAIGNDGDPPPRGDGIADNSNEVPAPAAADGAIAVGSVYDHETIGRSDDTLSDFSFTGPRQDDGDDDKLDELKPDVVSYGEDIDSAQANTNSGYIEYSGTSMSCPHVAGVVALMLDANPNLSPENVKEILHISSEQRGSPSFPELDPRYNTHYGWGIVDAFRAVEMARGYVELDILIDDPTEYEVVRGTIDISGAAYVVTGTGEIASVEISIDDPTFQTYTLDAEGTSEWRVTWDTVGWEGQRTIYAKATSGDYSAVASVTVIVDNVRESGDGDGLEPEDDSQKIILPFGIGKVSLLAAAAFVGILATIIIVIIAGILLRRRRKYMRLIAARRAEQGLIR